MKVNNNNNDDDDDDDDKLSRFFVLNEQLFEGIDCE